MHKYTNIWYKLWFVSWRRYAGIWCHWINKCPRQLLLFLVALIQLRRSVKIWDWCRTMAWTVRQNVWICYYWSFILVNHRVRILRLMSIAITYRSCYYTRQHDESSSYQPNNNSGQGSRTLYGTSTITAASIPITITISVAQRCNTIELTA